MEKVLSKRLLLTLFFVGVIVASLTLVVAQAPSDIFDPVRDMFASWDSGDISPNIAKYLFFILLAAFVWSILDTSGIVSNGIVKWIISVIVSFLSVAYLSVTDIWILLTPYSAFGLTLLFVLPTLILVFFTFRIAFIGGASGVIAQHLIWIIYFVFLVWKFVTGIINGQITPNASITWVFVGILILVGIAALFNKLLIYLIGEEILKAQSQAAGSLLKRAAQMTRLDAEKFEDLAS
jgi:hypothetical protein